MERHLFDDARALLAEVRRLCTQFPEPTIVVSLDIAAPFVSLSALSPEQLERLIQHYHPTPAFVEVKVVVQALISLNLRSYCAPSVEYLPTVPLHRVLMRPALGSASEVCAIVALLHHMREQQASWEEMNFFYINAGESGTCLLVIVNGQIINGIDPLQGSALPVTYGYLGSLGTAQGLADAEKGRQEALQSALKEAFWEGLTQELSGLLAVHHLEDLVVLGQQDTELVERLTDTYQIYLFPYARTEFEGYESALGAALLGEGLEQEGNSAEVVHRLQLRQAEREPLAPGF